MPTTAITPPAAPGAAGGRRRALGVLGVLGLLLTGWPAAACDMCGCFMGLTPYDNQSSVTLLTRYRVFHGYAGQGHALFPAGAPVMGLRAPAAAPGLAEAPRPGTAQRVSHDGHDHAAAAPDGRDFEAFRVVELRGRYFLSRRIELNAVMPYVLNDALTAGDKAQTRGLGDLTLFAGYHVVRRIETAGVQHRLIVGGGAKLPTGATTRRAADGTRYETLLQPGSGTTDAFAYVNYIVGYRRFGLSVNSSVKLTGENRYRQSAAPATTQFANLFYQVALGEQWKVIPSAQFYYEYTKGEKANGQLTGEHLMNNALVGPGLDVFFQNLLLSSSVQLPVFSNGSAGHPVSAGRVTLGLTYNINQMKYALGKK